MRVILQTTKDSLAIVAFILFPAFIVIFHNDVIWTLLVTFLFGGALLDACISMYLCATKQIFASTVKDGFGAVGLFAFATMTSIVGPTLVVRTIMSCFFVMAFVIDAFFLVLAFSGCYNIYTHDLGSYQVVQDLEQGSL